MTADTSGIADDDGLDSVAFSYQWQADGADIAGATGSTYALADADEGAAISVKVSFTDDRGNEETLTSAATGAVAPKANSPATGAPAITGTAQVGETLTVDTSDVANEDGLDKATFSYQWVVNEESYDSTERPTPWWSPTTAAPHGFRTTGRRHGHRGRHGSDLHAHRSRRGEAHKGAGELRRRRGQLRDADQRPDAHGGHPRRADVPTTGRAPSPSNCGSARSSR